MSSVDFNIKEIADTISEMQCKYNELVAHRIAYIKKNTYELERQLQHSLTPKETKDKVHEMVLYIEQVEALQTAFQELRVWKAGSSLLKDIEMKCYGLMLFYTRLFHTISDMDIMDEIWWMEGKLWGSFTENCSCKKEDGND